MLYIISRPFSIVLVILLLRWCSKKLFPNLSRIKKIVILLLVATLLFFVVDFILVQNSCDPLFAIPLWAAGDGGSTYYVGLFYHVYKSAAYTLGSGESPFFQYYIAPWFFTVVE